MNKVMGDSYGNPQQNSRSFDEKRGGPRGGRGPGNREGGGFRIRLSDNEMKAARAIQEAFNLRSTVAVLGFAIRTLGQMLEDGKLDDLISQNKSQTGNTSENATKQGKPSRNIDKPNPFARPSKPPSQESEAQKDTDSDEITTSTIQENLSEKDVSDNSTEANPSSNDLQDGQSTNNDKENSNETKE